MDETIRFVNFQGVEIARPREWQPAGIAIACPSELWDSARLTVQGRTLPLVLRRLANETFIYTNWDRAGAGHYHLHFESDDISAERTITIEPEKISTHAFAEMLIDLESRLPLSIAIRLQQGGALAGYQLPESSKSTIAQEVQRVVRALNGTSDYAGLIVVLRDLAADPHITLGRNAFWQRAERARRPPVSAIRQAMLTPGNLSGSNRPLRVIDERIDPDVNTAENRLLRLYHDQVDRRLRRLLAHPGLDDAWRIDLQFLSIELRRARRTASWLDDVRADAPPLNRVSMVQLRRPPYRFCLSGWLEFHRSVTVRFEDPALDAPLAGLPTLYERWGTLIAIDALLEVAPAFGFVPERERLFGQDHEGIFLKLFPDQEAVRFRHPRTGEIARLLVQPQYSDTGALRSVTYEQRPDVAIEWSDASGSRELVVFDPKYKLASDEEPADAKPTKTDIDKMHAYRDAIRDSSGRRVVSHAAILYPGPEVHWHDSIGAYSAVPGQSSTLRASLATAISLLLGRSS